jgi:hypothetical protein
LFQVFKPLGRGELLIIKYCLVLPQRSPVSPEESILFRAQHAFPLPCKKEEPAGMGGLDGSLVHPQLIPAQTSKKVIRYHFRSRDVPPTTGVGVSGRANPSNFQPMFTRNPPQPISILGRGVLLVNTGASVAPGNEDIRFNGDYEGTGRTDSGEGRETEKSVGAMNLYRNPADLDYWYIRVSKNVWLTFPAKVNGWLERRPVRQRDLSLLQPVPRWLAFNTGMPKVNVKGQDAKHKPFTKRGPYPFKRKSSL